MSRKRKRSDDEQQGNFGSSSNENDEERHGYTERTNKRRKIQTPHNSEEEIYDNVDADSDPEYTSDEDIDNNGNTDSQFKINYEGEIDDDDDFQPQNSSDEEICDNVDADSESEYTSDEEIDNDGNANYQFQINFEGEMDYDFQSQNSSDEEIDDNDADSQSEDDSDEEIDDNDDTDSEPEYYYDEEIDDNVNADPESELNLPQNELILKCVWLECEYEEMSVCKFAQHVVLHEPRQIIHSNADGKDVYYKCEWYLCDFETRDRNEIGRHISFHSYHTSLKCVGKNVAKQSQLPCCNRSIETRNQLPPLPNRFTCCWEYCKFSSNDPYMFFYHVDEHLKQQPCGENINCGWTNCMTKFKTITELEEHVRTHTLQKTLACPTCGSLFESSPEFMNHMFSEPAVAPGEVGQFVCDYCKEIYPTLVQLWKHITAMHQNM